MKGLLTYLLTVKSSKKICT